MGRSRIDDPPRRSAIVAIVDTRRAQTLLLKRFDDDREYPAVWCFPGGTVEGDERTEDAARREVLEETGYTISNLEYVGRQTSISASGRAYLIDCFICVNWRGMLIALPSEEHAAAAWVPIADLPRLEPVGTTTAFLAHTVTERYPTDASRYPVVGLPTSCQDSPTIDGPHR